MQIFALFLAMQLVAVARSSDEVSLVGGSFPSEGNVLLGGLPVCDNNWDNEDADVICKMLGYPGGEKTIHSTFGPVSVEFSMTDVGCDGSEAHIKNCTHLTEHQCKQREGAGVRCYLDCSDKALGTESTTCKSKCTPGAACRGLNGTGVCDEMNTSLCKKIPENSNCDGSSTKNTCGDGLTCRTSHNAVCSNLDSGCTCQKVHSCGTTLNPGEEMRNYSSVRNNDKLGTGHARSMLGSRQAWSAASNSASESLTIDLGRIMQAYGTVVQGRHDLSSQWVRQYTVEYSRNGLKWASTTGTFAGSRWEIETAQYFQSPVQARYVKLIVETWEDHISMRAGVIACPLDCADANLGTASSRTCAGKCRPAGAACEGLDGTGVCDGDGTCKKIAAGGNCGGEPILTCATGSICQSTSGLKGACRLSRLPADCMCAVEETKSCAGDPLLTCLTGLICVKTDGSACTRGVGQTCTCEKVEETKSCAGDPLLTCSTGLICVKADGSACTRGVGRTCTCEKVPENGNCDGSPTKKTCADGLTCRTTSNAVCFGSDSGCTCQKVPENGNCDERRAKKPCVDGLTCRTSNYALCSGSDSGCTCQKVADGQSCRGNPLLPCYTGLTCVKADKSACVAGESDPCTCETISCGSTSNIGDECSECQNHSGKTCTVSGNSSGVCKSEEGEHTCVSVADGQPCKGNPLLTCSTGLICVKTDQTTCVAGESDPCTCETVAYGQPCRGNPLLTCSTGLICVKADQTTCVAGESDFCTCETVAYGQPCKGNPLLTCSTGLACVKADQTTACVAGESDPCTCETVLENGKCDGSSTENTCDDGLTCRTSNSAVCSGSDSGCTCQKVYSCSTTLNPAEEMRSYSSVYGDDALGTGHARSMLDSLQAWSAASNTANQSLTIDLGGIMQAYGTVVQGRHGVSSQWVRQYAVQYSSNGLEWTSTTRTFAGASLNNKTAQYFQSPVQARYVKLIVKKWEGHISMRAGVIACPIDCTDANLGTASISTCASKCKPAGAACRGSDGRGFCDGESMCKKIDCTDASLGTASDSICASKCKPAGAACRSSDGTGVCDGESTCKKIDCTDASLGTASDICVSKCKPVGAPCRSSDGTGVCDGESTCKKIDCTDASLGTASDSICAWKCKPAGAACRSSDGTGVCDGESTCKKIDCTDASLGTASDSICASKCKPAGAACRSADGTGVCDGESTCKKTTKQNTITTTKTLNSDARVASATLPVVMLLAMATYHLM